MENTTDRLKVDQVAACTITAVHGRDHTHAFTVECCHPHAVELVFLGRRHAMTVCHDCRLDSGFLPRWEAEHLAERHRDRTREVSVSLPLAQAG
jgi:hypothetical protein